MTTSILVPCAVLFALLVVSGMCSSSETAFFSLSSLHIRQIGKTRPALGRKVQHLMATPTRLLSAILIINTVVNSLFAAIGYTVIAAWSPRYAEQIAIPALTVFLLWFGEVGPKRAGLLYTDSFIRFFTPILGLMIRVTAPLRFLLEKLTRKLERHFRPRSEHLTNDEFKSVVDYSREQGIINAEELAMVKAIIDLEATRASDVMTPRVDLKCIDLNALPDDIPSFVRAAKMHYLLLYRDELDNVEGFLDARAFLLQPEPRLETALLTPFFVPISVPLSDLMRQFQKNKRRAAIVVDEFGGIAGLVTRGDILEEISGDIYQELSKPRPVFQEAGPHRWLVDATIHIDELNRKLLLNLDDEEADRLAGWMAAQLGHIPESNEVVEAQGCRVTVMQTNKRRVTLALIEKGKTL